MRSWHQGRNLKVVVQAPRVHLDQVLSLAVVVGPAKGLQPDLRPAQVWDWPTHDQCWLAVSKSFPERRPVEAMMMMMMPCTLPTRETCLKAVCSFLISLSPTMRILANAKHVSLLVKVTPTSQHGKTNSSVMEQQVCKNGTMWWTTILMVGRGSPKIPTSLVPLSLIWRNVEFLSPYPPQQILWGYVVFTPRIQRSYLRLHLQSCRLRQTISRVCFFSQRHSLSHISLLCSKVAQLLRWDCCRNCILGVHLLVFLSTGLMRPRTGTGLAYPVARFVRILSRMTQHTWTTLSVHAL